MSGLHECQVCSERETKLFELKAGVVEIKQLLADLRSHLESKAGFNPDQPRDERGRWTQTPGTTLAQVDPSRKYSVILSEEEARGGHAIRRHVGRTDEDLLAVMRAATLTTPFLRVAKEREGSFVSLESANDFVNRVLESNTTIVDLVSTGALPDAWIEHQFGYHTGREAYRPDAYSDPYMRNTYSVGVFIKHDRRSSRGYTIITAYPPNERSKK